MIYDDESMLLQLAVWDYMHYLTHTVKIDDPSQIENRIKSIVHDCISEYVPELELDEENSQW